MSSKHMNELQTWLKTNYNIDLVQNNIRQLFEDGEYGPVFTDWTTETSVELPTWHADWQDPEWGKVILCIQHWEGKWCFFYDSETEEELLDCDAFAYCTKFIDYIKEKLREGKNPWNILRNRTTEHIATTMYGCPIEPAPPVLITQAVKGWG